jgi:hypothetical protein
LLRFRSAIDSLRERELQHNRSWLVGALVVVWLMWVLPFHLIPSLSTFGAAVVALGIFTGIVLGVGRQGIDLLAIRLFAASTAVLTDTPAVCSGPADCFHAYEIGIVGFGLFATVVLAVFAIPTNIAWNRGINRLKPELPWLRLSQLKTWQWNVLWLGVAAFLLAFYISLGIPFPP